jgi:hypothetical protein
MTEKECYVGHILEERFCLISWKNVFADIAGRTLLLKWLEERFCRHCWKNAFAEMTERTLLLKWLKERFCRHC